MTKMLASVADLAEARIALQEHVSIIDLKDPRQGVLGSVATGVTTEVVELVAGRCLVSATIGDLPMQVEPISEAISALSITGVDLIKVGVFGELTDDVFGMLQDHAIHGVGMDTSATERFSLVMVFFADQYPLPSEECIDDLADAGIRGVMLDTADKSRGSLRAHMEDEDISMFVREMQSCDFFASLAGSLGIADIAPLLAMQPDYLGFRGALCKDSVRTQTLDSVAVRQIRSLVMG